MDDDHKGGVSYGEFVVAMRHLGMRESPEQLRWVAQALDTGGHGCIVYSDFADAMVQSNEMEEGFIQSELQRALGVVHGTSTRALPPRPAGAPRTAPKAYPQTPSSLKAGWSDANDVAAIQTATGEPQEEESVEVRKEKLARSARRVEERAAARKRLKVQQVLDTLRQQVEMFGSVAAAFRKLEVSGDSQISQEELSRALKRRFHIEMSDETAAGVMREFDEDGDGAISYQEFVKRLLGKSDIDYGEGSGRDGATGAGGRHVSMSEHDQDRKVAAQVQAGGALNPLRRHAAARAMEDLKKKLYSKHKNLRDAFRAIDVDADHSLTYDEFGQLVSDWMPELDETRVRDVCRLLDADGDGTIDFEEFSKAVTARGDDMRQGTAALLRAREQANLANTVTGRGGRFGATPSFAYGVQARELLESYPGAIGYQSEAERFGPTVAKQLVPAWQTEAAARKANHRAVRREQTAFHRQRIEAGAVADQRMSEGRVESRMESLVTQKERYLSSVAGENRAKLGSRWAAW